MVLIGLRITGGLNLEATELQAPLIAHGCWFDEPISVSGTTASELRLTACRIPGLAGDQLHTRGDLDLSASEVGVVSLQRAHIGGSVLLIGTELARGTVPIALGDGTLRPREAATATREGISLMAEGIHIEGDLLCEQGFRAGGEVHLSRARVAGMVGSSHALFDGDLIAEGLQVEGALAFRDGFVAKGVVALPGARVSRDISMIGAKLQALSADSCRVDGGLFLREGFRCEEKVRLIGGTVAGQISFSGSRLVDGLHADRLSAGAGMYFRSNFHSSGEVRLCGAEVGGQLSLTGATLTSSTGLALDLEGARIDQDLMLRFAEPPAGGVDLTDTRAGRIADSEATWPSLLRLESCEYGAVYATEDWESRPPPHGRWQRLWMGVKRLRPSTSEEVKRRLRWLSLAEQERYSPRPYTQLVETYRRQGRDADARRVAYERELRRASGLRPAGRAWNAFLRWTVGYGYKPLRAVALLIALVVVGGLVFASFHAQSDLVASRPTHPQFVASIYALDRLVPVISFGLRDAYVPHGAAQWWAFAYTLIGWALTVAVIAGLNAAVRRE